jgi:uncharacterized protein with beta-barrel porin domain
MMVATRRWEAAELPQLFRAGFSIVPSYTIAGFALAGGATNFNVNGLGSGRSDLFQAGAFVRHTVGAAYLTGALAYAEQAIAGANTFALSYAGKSVTDSRSELGLRTDKSFAMQNGIFTLRGRAAWAHDFNTDRAIAPTFQTLPGASFVVNGGGAGA